MKVQVILASAGVGKRLGLTTAKPFILVNDRPLVSYALEIFEQCSLVHSIVIAAETFAIEWMKNLVDQAEFSKVKHVVAGGNIRAQSVKNALKVLDSDTDYVLIHDGARPMITVDFVEEMIRAADGTDALITAVPVKPTIKQVDPETLCVEQTLDRERLWDVQTPQIFSKEILDEAYAIDDINATDDAALVERRGKTVKIFPGLEKNIKITTRYDLLLAEKILGGES